MKKKMRELVSGDKYRHKVDGFDLDLTYITDNVIAMGIPGEGVSQNWRNNVKSVANFLNSKHPGHYKVYNVSTDKYDYHAFHNQVKEYGFPDHSAPSLTLLKTIVSDMDAYIKSDARNVAAVHCLAGRSRTGTIVCSYLLRSGKCKTADEAIKFFNEHRSKNGLNVVLPSQVRTVHYFEKVMRTNMDLTRPKKLFLDKVIIKPVPLVEGGGGTVSFKKSYTGGACTPVIKVMELAAPRAQIKEVVGTSVWKDDRIIDMEIKTFVRGGVQLKFFHIAKNSVHFGKTLNRLHGTIVGIKAAAKYPLVPLFRYTFHTNFVKSSRIVIPVPEIDNVFAGALKPSSYIPQDMTIELHFTQQKQRVSSLPSSIKPQGKSYLPPTRIVRDDSYTKRAPSAPDATNAYQQPSIFYSDPLPHANSAGHQSYSNTHYSNIPVARAHKPSQQYPRYAKPAQRPSRPPSHTTQHYQPPRPTPVYAQPAPLNTPHPVNPRYNTQIHSNPNPPFASPVPAPNAVPTTQGYGYNTQQPIRTSVIPPAAYNTGAPQHHTQPPLEFPTNQPF